MSLIRDVQAPPAAIALPQPTASTAARDLITSVTDERSNVDTVALAAMVHEASGQDAQRASIAYGSIRDELSQHSIMTAAQFERDAEAVFESGPPLTAVSLFAGTQVSEAGKSVLRNNPILSVVWESTENAKGQKGFPSSIEDRLTERGIVAGQTARPRPPGLLSSQPADRSYNGNLASEAIAKDYSARGYTVRTEVTEPTPLKTEPRPSGDRRIDIVATKDGATPEKAERVDIESKLGRVKNDTETRLQIDKDGWRLDQNKSVRFTGQALDTGGKLLKPVGLVLDGVQIGEAIQADGGEFGPNAQRTTAGVAGGAVSGIGGAWAGAAAGAAIGSVIPGVGTAVGGVVGGLVGAFAGGIAGEEAGQAIYDHTR